MDSESHGNPSDSSPIPPLDYANPLNRASGCWLLPVFFWTFFSLLLFFVACALLLPSMGRHDGSFREKSQSNLRQIGQAILLYSNDHQDQYPDSFQTILLNEDVTAEVFVSPSRNETAANGATTQAIVAQLTPNSGHLSYVYLGKGLSMKTVTPDIVVAYELLSNPTNGTNMLFGDGHVEYIDPPTTAKIIARASAGQFSVTMPR